MSILLQNTHHILASLEKNGFSRHQAEGIVETLQEIDLSHLATKGDLLELRQDIMHDILKWIIPLILGLYALLIVKIGF